MIIFCLGQPKSIKNTFHATSFKVEEGEKFNDFSRVKWNSRTSPKIQGLFMTVRTLLQFNRKFPISDLKDMVPISKESKRYD